MSSNPNRPLVIIHGWSDISHSFKRLAAGLQQALNISPTLINLADYISMDDFVTFPDLSAAMMRAWTTKKIPLSPGSVDIIGHSAAGLVIRQWLIDYFDVHTVPVKHCVLLAPANFGSFLAHKGRAFYARIFETLNPQQLGQAGKNLLKQLELASPYTWKLAMQDRFGPFKFYDKGCILTTVFAGDSGFSGLSAAANELGSDGTVRISNTNLNCTYCKIHFNQQAKISIQPSTGEIAFGILSGENHRSIIGENGQFNNKNTLALIAKALRVDDHNFLNWKRQLKKSLKKKTQSNIKQTAHRFQNTIVRVTDHLGHEVEDYFLEFRSGEQTHYWLDELFHKHIIERTHINLVSPSYRCINMNANHMRDKTWNTVSLGISAHPNIDHPDVLVGYETCSTHNKKAIQITQELYERTFHTNQTLLLDIQLQRLQKPRLFKLRSLDA